MKFSKNTIDILKSFTSINPGIYFRKGSIITSVHPHKYIMGQAKIEEQIPQDFVIHNLGSFLGALSLNDNPNLEIKDNKVVMKFANGRTANYPCADLSVLKAPPDKDVSIDHEISINLTSDELESIRKASTVMALDFLRIHGNGEIVVLTAYDAKDPKISNYTINTSVQSDKIFTCIFKMSNMNIVSGGYDIHISLTGKTKAGEFICKDHPIKYIVAVESDSKIG